MKIVVAHKPQTETAKNDAIYTLGSFNIATELVPHDYGKYSQFCMSGCRNYNTNGGCPPFSPNFKRLQEIYKTMTVIYVRLDICDTPETFKTEKKVKNLFFMSSFVQSTLSSVIRGCVGAIKNDLKPDMELLESCCKGCGKNCNFKTGENRCNKPHERRYSLESTGVDVDGLMRIGAFPLHWFKQGVAITEVPYTVKVVGFLYKENAPEIDVVEFIQQRISNIGKYDMVLLKEINR